MYAYGFEAYQVYLCEPIPHIVYVCTQTEHKAEVLSAEFLSQYDFHTALMV